jgi:hypothetical protein
VIVKVAKTTPSRTDLPAATRWVSVQTAADLLGMTAAALRKALDRRSIRTPDGGIEAELDGVRGRKLGRLWRVSLGPAWSSSPELPSTPKNTVASATSQNRAD